MDEVAEAVAADRRRLAARLHDGPIQQLTAAQLFLDTALAQMPQGEPNPLLSRALEALRAAVEECRALMRELAGDEEDP